VRAQVVSFLLFVATPAAAAAGTAFESRRPGEVAVPVTIGASGPFRFLLDTGSTHSAITPRLAEAVAARPIARAAVAASAGTVECLVVALARVSVGPVAVDGLAATQLPDDAGVRLGPGVDGILGQDFLSRFSFTIDYVRSRIVWHDADPSRPELQTPGIRLPLVPSRERFVVELPQPGRRTALRVVPDSGADTLVLYDDPSIAGLVSEWAPGRAELASPTGTQHVRTGIVDGLRVGDRRLARQPAVVLPLRPEASPPAAGGVEPDGLLPLHLFAQASFNARERSLVLHPR
jgi:hypothetical protein